MNEILGDLYANIDNAVERGTVQVPQRPWIHQVSITSTPGGRGHRYWPWGSVKVTWSGGSVTWLISWQVNHLTWLRGRLDTGVTCFARLRVCSLCTVGLGDRSWRGRVSMIICTGCGRKIALQSPKLPFLWSDLIGFSQNYGVIH